MGNIIAQTGPVRSWARLTIWVLVVTAASLVTGCLSLSLGGPPKVYHHYDRPQTKEDPIKIGETATVHYAPASNADSGVVTGRLTKVSDGWLVVNAPEGERWVRVERIGDIHYH